MSHRTVRVPRGTKIYVPSDFVSLRVEWFLQGRRRAILEAEIVCHFDERPVLVGSMIWLRVDSTARVVPFKVTHYNIDRYNDRYFIIQIRATQSGDPADIIRRRSEAQCKRDLAVWASRSEYPDATWEEIGVMHGISGRTAKQACINATNDNDRLVSPSGCWCWTLVDEPHGA